MPAYPLIPAPSPISYPSVFAPYLLEHRPLSTLRWSEPESRSDTAEECIKDVALEVSLRSEGFRASGGDALTP